MPPDSTLKKEAVAFTLEIQVFRKAVGLNQLWVVPRILFVYSRKLTALEIPYVFTYSEFNFTSGFL